MKQIEKIKEDSGLSRLKKEWILFFSIPRITQTGEKRFITINKIILTINYETN
jgi:hypothetical protein|nr:hypothetical protein [uncultured Prevotella sp.]